MTITELCVDLPIVSQKIGARRLRLLGYCIRHPEKIASNMVLFQPLQVRPNRGRKRAIYIDNLLKDTNMQRVEELCSLIVDRDTWRMIVYIIVMAAQGGT